MNRLLVTDLDNTLVRCTVYYDEAKRAFWELMRATFEGLDREELRTLYRSIDATVRERRDGYEWQWFPETMPAVYRALCERHGVGERPSVAREAARLGRRIEEAPYEPFPGAAPTLERYRAAGWRVGLYTKGAPDLQRAKLERSGLEGLFDAVRIVPAKQARDLVDLAARLTEGAGADRAVMVGDSHRDDVRTGVEAGMETVLVEADLTFQHNDYHARYEGAARERYRPTHVIERVDALPTVIAPEPTRALAVGD